MLKVRNAGLTIKVRCGKIVLTGSSAAGKTSFFRLLMKQKHCEKYISTGVAETQQVTIAIKAHIEPSAQGDDVEFNTLTLDEEISQLRSRLHSIQKSDTDAHGNALPVSDQSNVLTKVENNIASNSEIEDLPEEPIEDVWNILTFMDTGG